MRGFLLARHFTVLSFILIGLAGVKALARRHSQELGHVPRVRFIPIAEGVNAEHPIGFLRELGCDQIPGYCYGKPQPAEGFAANWIKG